MRNTVFDTLEIEFKLNRLGNFLVDDIGFYPLTLQYLNDAKMVQVNFPFSESEYARYKLKLDEGLKEIGIKKMKYKNQVVTMLLSKKGKYLDQYAQLKSLVTPILTGKVKSLSCPYCGKTDGNILIFKNGLYIPAHEYCHKPLLEDLKDTIDDGTIMGYIKGILGAFIGATLPLLAAFILIATVNVSFGWLYAFSATTAALGYKIMKGPLGNRALFFTIISSCFSFILFIYINCIYSFYSIGILTTWSLGELFNNATILLFSDNFIDVIMLFDFEMLFFLIGLGILVFTKPFSKKEKIKYEEEKERLTRKIESYY